MLYTKSPLDKDMEPSFLVRSFYFSSFSLVLPQFKLWESCHVSKKKRKENDALVLSNIMHSYRRDWCGVV